MTRADANGSFRILSSGAIQYTGTGGGDNQIVTYNPDNESFEDTNLEELFGGACVSQYLPSAPSKRPNGGDLEVGDFWTATGNKFIHIWDGDEWIQVKTVNGNPVGTIIQTIADSLTATAPEGYLLCDGTLCPEEFTQLRAMLLANTGDFFLPSLPGGNYIKH